MSVAAFISSQRAEHQVPHAATWHDAVLAIGDLQPAVQAGLRDPEAAADPTSSAPPATLKVVDVTSVKASSRIGAQFR